VLIDATDLVLGRMASAVAKQLLEGEEVKVVNAEKAVITGRRKSTLGEYDAWIRIRALANPRKGPLHPRRPEDLVRRTVRGMIPYKKSKGREAYRRLKVYVGIPAELEKEKAQPLPGAHLDRSATRRFIRIGELSKRLGAKF
jgi:large subunit ribosomal protein L13